MNTPKNNENPVASDLSDAAGSPSAILRDNTAQMQREFIVNGEVAYTISAMDVGTANLPTHWYVEWKCLWRAPWGAYNPEMNLIQENPAIRRGAKRSCLNGIVLTNF